MPNGSEVYVIDDDEAIRGSLAFLLRTAGFVARAYDSAQVFLAEAADLAPGCVITDVRMPGLDGIELVRRLAAAKLPLAAIVVTGHGDIAMAVEAMKAGAVDFLEKPFRDEVLLRAVERALGGPALPDAADRQRDRAALQGLSPRERQVLEGVVSGKTSKAIARDLDISPRTVEVHRAGMMMKSGAKSLSDLVRMALLAGL